MLKMRALTEQLYVDEVDIDEEGIAETLMDNNAIANVPRPGTSLKQPSIGTGAISRGVRYHLHELFLLSVLYSILPQIGVYIYFTNRATVLPEPC